MRLIKVYIVLRSRIYSLERLENYTALGRDEILNEAEICGNCRDGDDIVAWSVFGCVGKVAA